jgi:hypothetical protein
VRRVIESLEPDNTLRLALERGRRGSGAHYLWMDTMRQYGVKQASFRVRVRRDGRALKVKVLDVKYLTHYYRYDSAIEDLYRVEQIRAAGLEAELRAEILRRAKADLPLLTRDGQPDFICGTLYFELLDDEDLPISTEMPQFDDDDCMSGADEAVSSSPSGAIITKGSNL